MSLEGTERFSIGEVARMFRVSVSTLRHYEKIGLLAPEYVDPATGYRSYSTRQFECLNTIRYLRALEMPLEQIPGFSPGPGGGEDPGDAPPAAAGRHPKTPGVGNRAAEDREPAPSDPGCPGRTSGGGPPGGTARPAGGLAPG